MREILFRAKRIDNGEWIEGDLRHGSYLQDDKEIYIMKADYALHNYPVIPETVGQYTGLTDTNGKKIFEGDIIKTKYGRLCIVVWFSSPGYNGWYLEAVRTVDNCLHTRKPDSADLYYSDNLEIVGNIYDTPEFLEGGEQND